VNSVSFDYQAHATVREKRTSPRRSLFKDRRLRSRRNKKVSKSVSYEKNKNENLQKKKKKKRAFWRPNNDPYQSYRQHEKLEKSINEWIKNRKDIDFSVNNEQ
jgi:hypothetical protein